MISEPPPVCKGCGREIISEPIVQALNHDWHPRCFRCSSCGDRLNNWYIQTHGNLYCRRDYWTKFGGLCQGCLQIISGPVMVAGEHKYHPECFQCSMCHCLIGDGEAYALVERSFLFCGHCYRAGPSKPPSPLPPPQPSPPTATKSTSASSAGRTPKTPRRKPHTIQMVEIPPTPEQTPPQTPVKTHHDYRYQQIENQRQEQKRKRVEDLRQQQQKQQQQHREQQEQEKQQRLSREETTPRRLQVTLQASLPDYGGSSGGWRGSGSFRNSFTLEGGRITPCVQISGLGSSPELNGLAVGDKILEINGATVRDKSLEEISNLLANPSSPIHVMLERDLSPLRLSAEEDSKASPSPVRRTASRDGAGSDDPTSSSTSEGEMVMIQDQPVRLRPKGSLRAKGHSPSRRRSKSPSPCPAARQKSMDLSRSHSFSTRQQDQRIFRAVDLVIGEVLGQGFFGQAIKATHRVTGEQMVLKELHNFDEDAQKSFLREVSMLRNLSHPCVLKFMGVLYRDKKLNLVTEFIDAGTLSDLLLDDTVELSWKQRVAFAKDIASGMNYLHSMDIIHRDLNSQNCFVRKDQTVVVADFGLAKIFPRQEKVPTQSQVEKEKEGGSGGSSVGSRKKKRFSRKKRGTVVGNPYWMAPEMMTKGVYDEKVDVFSFGIIVCETIARVTADPDYLPRSIDFGLNVEAFHKRFCKDAPEPYFMLAVLCAQLEPDQRPSFERIHVLCEALHLHVEHGMAAPTELQGSTVDFYRAKKEEMYGKNYEDVDSCTQANTDKNKDTAPLNNNSKGTKRSEAQESDANALSSKDAKLQPLLGTVDEVGGVKSTSSSSGASSSLDGEGDVSLASKCSSEDALRSKSDSEMASLSDAVEQQLDIVEKDNGTNQILNESDSQVKAPICSPVSPSHREGRDRESTKELHLNTEDGTADVSTTTTTTEDYAYFSCSSSSPSISPSSPCLSAEEFASCKSSPDASWDKITPQSSAISQQNPSLVKDVGTDINLHDNVPHFDRSNKSIKSPSQRNMQSEREKTPTQISNEVNKELRNSPNTSSLKQSQSSTNQIACPVCISVTSPVNITTTAQPSLSPSREYKQSMQVEYGNKVVSPPLPSAYSHHSTCSSHQVATNPEHFHTSSSTDPSSFSTAPSSQNLPSTDQNVLHQNEPSTRSNLTPNVPYHASHTSERTITLGGTASGESEADAGSTSDISHQKHQTSRGRDSSQGTNNDYHGTELSSEISKISSIEPSSYVKSGIELTATDLQAQATRGHLPMQTLTVTAGESAEGSRQEQLLGTISPTLLSPDHERGLSSSRRRLRRSMKNNTSRDNSPNTTQS